MDDDNTKHMDSAADAAEGDPPAPDDSDKLDEMLSGKMLEMWPLTEKEREINRAFWASTDPDDVALRETMKRQGRTPYPLRAGMHYILADDLATPVDCPNVLKWGRWMDDFGHRVVKQTTVGHREVSTVFLGIDHSFGRMRMLSLAGLEDGEEPLSLVLWETMIFNHGLVSLYNPETKRSEATVQRVDDENDSLSYYQERYSSRAEAMAGHIRAVDACLAKLAE